MNELPKDIENIILDYKLQLEIEETRKKFSKSLKILKQFNHNVIQNSYRTELSIIIGNITNRFCIICNNFIVKNYHWKRGSNWKVTEKHFCKC